MFNRIFIYLFNLALFSNNKNFNKNNFIFSKISNLHIDYLYKNNFTELPIKQDFINKTSKIKNGYLENYYFSNYKFNKIRLSYFKSDDKQMFNSVWYPSYDYDCPILSIDLINFGLNKSVYLINLFEIYDKKEYFNLYIDPFVNIRNNYSELNNIFSMHFTPFKKIYNKAIIFNNIDNNKDDVIVDILSKYINKYNSIFSKRPVNRYYIQDKHIEYNNIRKNIDKNFITKEYFEDDWFKRLLTEYYN